MPPLRGLDHGPHLSRHPDHQPDCRTSMLQLGHRPQSSPGLTFTLTLTLTLTLINLTFALTPLP